MENRGRRATVPVVDAGTGDVREAQVFVAVWGNGVVDALKVGRLDEAERLCQQLAERYPDFVDPLERYAMLYEARGDYGQAADHYRRAADYARTHEGFDPELIDFWLADAARVEALAQQPAAPRRHPAPHPGAG